MPRPRLLPILLIAVLGLTVTSAHAQRRRLANLGWWERAPVASSAFYQIKTDLPRDEAKVYGRHLDRMYREFSRRLASLPPRAPEKLDVYLFSRQDEYLQILRTRWGIDATGSGGMFFINPGGSGLALWTQDLPRRRVFRVIQHEGFHQFAYSRFGTDLPQWVNEGMAELFGRGVPLPGRLLLGQATEREIEAAQNAIELGASVPFDRMLAMSNGAWNEKVRQGKSDVLYRQSWSMVHFLVYGDGGRYAEPFERYLRLLNNGVPSEAAFIDVFGADLGPFEKRWTVHVNAMKPSAVITAVDRLEFLAEGAFELSRRGVVPESLEELKEALRAIEFTHEIGSHDNPVVLSARSDAAFEIPPEPGGNGADTERRAVFEVVKVKLINLTRREREREKTNPTPAVISTKGLRPSEIAIRWERGDAGAMRYVIVVR